MLTREPIYIMLVGLPGSGKSYLRAQLVAQATQANVPLTALSTDDWIDMMGQNNGKTYSENFQTFIAEAEEQLRLKRQFAFDHNWSIIHDQTNLTVGSRRKKLSQVPKRYRKVAVYMTTSDEQAAIWRAGRVGKEISEAVIKQMRQGAMVPSLEEGFDFVLPDLQAHIIFQ